MLFAHGAMLRVWATVRGVGPGQRSTTRMGRPRTLHNTGMIVLDVHRDGGWRVVSWAGAAIGGARLDDGAADGPAGGTADPEWPDVGRPDSDVTPAGRQLSLTACQVRRSIPGISGCPTTSDRTCSSCSRRPPVEG